MKEIVLELQEEALSSDIDILSLLRKAYLIARKLSLSDFSEWLNFEMNGYPTTCDVPDYRIAYGEIKAWNPYHGWIPVIFDKTTDFHKNEIRDPIASLKSVYDNSEGQHCLYTYSPEANALLSKYSPLTTKFSLFVPNNLIFNVFEQVKNKILDWAIILEENGIEGNDLKFTEEEKNRAINTPVIVNYINNFYSNVIDSQIQQDTIDSKQSHSNI